jgi:hypothetical protein
MCYGPLSAYKFAKDGLPRYNIVDRKLGAPEPGKTRDQMTGNGDN